MRVWDTVQYFLLAVLAVVIWWTSGALYGIPALIVVFAIQVYKMRAEDAFDQERYEDGENLDFDDEWVRRANARELRWQWFSSFFEGKL